MLKEKKSPIKFKIVIRLWKYVYQYKWLLFLAFFLTISSNLLTLIGPMLSGYAIDAIEPGKSSVIFNKVFFYCGLMILFYIASSLLSYILSIIMINLSQKIVYKMRKDVFNKLIELPVSYFSNYQTGDIISRITYDIDTINSSLSNDLLQICTSIITVIGSLIMMILISPTMVSIFIVTIPLSIFFTRYMTGKVKPLFRKKSKKIGELNGFVEEIISGQKTIKAYSQEENIISKFDIKNKATVDSYYNAEYYGNMVGPSVNFINNLSLSLVSILGAILYLLGNLTLGNVSSFVLYSRKFSGPINEMANIISELQSATAAAERVFNLMDEKPEVEDIENPKIFTEVKGNVNLSNISFGYNPNKLTLHNLNLNAEQGKLIAIVGPTGSGKTTLINLLMRFYETNYGKITLDNVDIQKATRKSLRQSYAMVLQDTWLFEGTIFENIAYGRDNATLEQVIKAAKAAKIHNYIKQLPNGYDTILNEEGLNISQGQKQLLTIARAILMDSKMLILDEATSNVDTMTEIQIQKALRNLMKDKTCFIIAHRLSTIQNADTILVIKDGKIIEEGDHNYLLNKKGLYSDLYYSQFESY